MWNCFLQLEQFDLDEFATSQHSVLIYKNNLNDILFRVLSCK